MVFEKEEEKKFGEACRYHNTLCSNPIIAADAKDFVFIMQIVIISSDYVPEFGQDDCRLFVLQYSFASQRWKLAQK